MKKLLLNLLTLLLMSFAIEAYADDTDITTVFSNDFSEFTNGSEDAPGTTDIGGYSGALYSSTAFPKWTGSKVYEAGEKLLIADNGYIETSSYNMNAQKGVVRISMKLRARDNYGGYITIALGYSTTINVMLTDDKWTDYSIVTAGGSSYSKLRVTASLSVNGVFIDDLKVETSADFVPAPTVYQPTTATKTSFTAKWKSVSSATGYLLDVYSKTDSGKEYLLQDEACTGTSKAVTGLDASKQYYYTVRAVNGEKISEYSEEIRIVPVIETVEAPVATDATNITDLGFTANWQPVADAAYYTISLSRFTTISEDKDIDIINEDFSKVTTGTLTSNDVSLPTQGSLDGYTQTSGWTQSGAVLAAGYMGLWPLSGSYIMTPALNLSDNSGKFTVTAEAAVNAYGTFYTGSFKIQLIDTDGQTVLEEKSIDITELAFATFNAEFTKGKNGAFVKFYYDGNSRLFFNSIKISQFKAAGSVIQEVVETHDTEATSYDFTVSAQSNQYFGYSVTASVETVVGGEIDYLESAASNTVTVPNSSAVESIQADAKPQVYTTDGAITVSTPTDANVEIYTTAGALLHREAIATGTTVINTAAKGVLLVRVAGCTYKVII